MERTGFVYIWYDRKHKRYYIGAHWGTEDDGYICSSSWMKQAYSHRPKDFRRRILSRNHQTKKEMFEAEDKWLEMIKEDEFKTKYYNFQKRWKHWSATDKAKSVRQKISEACKGKKHSEETKQKIGKALKGRTGRTLTLEQRKKISERQLGRKLSENHRKAISKSLIGRVSGMFGKKHSEETKRKIREYRHTPQAKEKMRIALIERHRRNNNGC